MKLALVGYGKMGKMMDSLSGQYGFEVVLRLDEFNNVNGAGMTKENFAGVDAAIEFTMPEAAIGNVETLAELGVNTVVGTTGWFSHLDRARAVVAKAGTGFVYASNFSVGVNIFERVVGETAKLMAQQDAYEAWAWEIHHSAKKDAPSGTLLTLVESMRKAGYERRIDQSASRAGAHPGTHEIGFDSAADTITLRHAARSREGFARGALHAARWVVGKQGFYEFRDVLFGQ